MRKSEENKDAPLSGDDSPGSDPSSEATANSEASPSPEKSTEEALNEFADSHTEATFKLRLGASLFDHALLAFLFSTMSLFANELKPKSAGPIFSHILNNVYGQICLVTFVVIYLLFFVLLEASVQMGTPGKRAYGLLVLHARDVRKLVFSESIKRFFCRIASCLPLGLGALVMLGHPEKKTLHDILSNTIVVEDKNLSKQRKMLAIIVTFALILGAYFLQSWLNYVPTKSAGINSALSNAVDPTASVPGTALTPEPTAQPTPMVEESLVEEEDVSKNAPSEIRLGIQVILLSTSIAVMDAERQALEVSFFNKRLTPSERAKFLVNKELARDASIVPDIELTLAFDQGSDNVLNGALRHYKIRINRLKDGSGGINLPGKAQFVEFLRIPGAESLNETVSIGSSVTLDESYSLVLIGSGQDPRISNTEPLKWQLVYDGLVRTRKAAESAAE